MRGRREHGKPDPRLIGLALGNSLGQAVMIGDTPYDAEAASGAGIAAAGPLTGGFAKQALPEAGCFAVADELLELPAIFKAGQRSRSGTG
jgi:phosphoglycolate phosphatase-like HAD superfamily hydrolase